jgi:hypothetical protein
MATSSSDLTVETYIVPFVEEIPKQFGILSGAPNWSLILKQAQQFYQLRDLPENWQEAMKFRCNQPVENNLWKSSASSLSFGQVAMGLSTVPIPTEPESDDLDWEGLFKVLLRKIPSDRLSYREKGDILVKIINTINFPVAVVSGILHDMKLSKIILIKDDVPQCYSDLKQTQLNVVIVLDGKLLLKTKYDAVFNIAELMQTPQMQPILEYLSSENCITAADKIWNSPQRYTIRQYENMEFLVRSVPGIPNLENNQIIALVRKVKLEEPVDKNVIWTDSMIKLTEGTDFTCHKLGNSEVEDANKYIVPILWDNQNPKGPSDIIYGQNGAEFVETKFLYEHYPLWKYRIDKLCTGLTEPKPIPAEEEEEEEGDVVQMASIGEKEEATTEDETSIPELSEPEYPPPELGTPAGGVQPSGGAASSEEATPEASGPLPLSAQPGVSPEKKPLETSEEESKFSTYIPDSAYPIYSEEFNTEAYKMVFTNIVQQTPLTQTKDEILKKIEDIPNSRSTDYALVEIRNLMKNNDIYYILIEFQLPTDIIQLKANIDDIIYSQSKCQCNCRTNLNRNDFQSTSENLKHSKIYFLYMDQQLQLVELTETYGELLDKDVNVGEAFKKCIRELSLPAQ